MTFTQIQKPKIQNNAAFLNKIFIQKPKFQVNLKFSLFHHFSNKIYKIFIDNTEKMQIKMSIFDFQIKKNLKIIIKTNHFLI